MSRYCPAPRDELRDKQTPILWWYCRRCSPLPIPNREVKPAMADGTAQQCGRVGSCHILLKVLNIVEDFFYAHTQTVAANLKIGGHCDVVRKTTPN